MVCYLYELYDFAHSSGAHHARMNQLAADGWRIHSASPNFTECSVLWEHQGLDSLEDYVASNGEDVPVTDKSAREQYLAQQEDSLSPGERDAARQRREDRKSEAEERAAAQREADWQRELEMRERIDQEAKAAAADQTEMPGGVTPAPQDAAQPDAADPAAPTEAPAGKGAKPGKQETREPQEAQVRDESPAGDA